MIAALISGRLCGQPQTHTARNGAPFVTGKVRASLDGETVYVSLITFHASAIAALTALADGDNVALAGEASLRTWKDKDGTVRPALDLTVSQVLTTYHVGRRRKAMQSADPERHEDSPPGNGLLDHPQPEPDHATAHSSGDEPTQALQAAKAAKEDFNDDIPF
jgi:single-stranded DNA-binding protein